MRLGSVILVIWLIIGIIIPNGSRRPCPQPSLHAV
jgi:hypothetical protein